MKPKNIILGFATALVLGIASLQTTYATENNNDVQQEQDEKVYYTVTMDSNLDVCPSATKGHSLTYEKGQNIKILFPLQSKATGISFVGWSRKPLPLLKAFDSVPEPYDKIIVNKDITMYAVWGEDKNQDHYADCLTVAVPQYVAPGATNVPTTQKEVLLTDIQALNKYCYYTISEQVPVKDDLKFLGWECLNVNADTLDEDMMILQPGDTLMIPHFKRNQIALKAKWEEKPNRLVPSNGAQDKKPSSGHANIQNSPSEFPSTGAGFDMGLLSSLLGMSAIALTSIQLKKHIKK